MLRRSATTIELFEIARIRRSCMEVDAEKSPVGVVHRICAGQVILDLSSAVKELVENSLDAGATSIEIALKEYGLEPFQVIDKASGVSPQNFKVLSLKHHTFKLLDFPDLQLLTTFGFRGEALSSLCALGELTVETRTIDEEVVATHLIYDHKGVFSEKLLGRSSIVQMSLNRFVTVNKRRYESVETVLSEVPLLRSEHCLVRMRVNSSLNHTPPLSSPGNCIDESVQ